jgi:competence protein ComEC
VALLALVGGITAGNARGAAPATAVLVAGGAGLAAAWFVRGRSRVVVAALALVLLGSALTQRAHDGLEREAVQRAEGTRVRITATVVSDADGPRYASDVQLRVDRGSTVGGAGIPSLPSGVRVLASATGDDAARVRLLTMGDRVVVSGLVRSLGPGDGWLRSRHVAARLERTDLLAITPPASPLYVIADRLRAIVLRGVASLPAEQRSLVAGFVLGDTRELPRDVELAYRDAGLSHLLAVSGANVAFALVLVAPLLRRLPLPGRCATGLTVVLVFATMTRFEPSVLRASALASAAMFADVVGRPVSRARLLALAIIACLLVDPFLLQSAGFVLSCAASAGIALLARSIAARVRGPVMLRDALGVSLAAQVGVAPVLLARFGSLPALAPIANLLAAPAAEPLGVLGLAGGGVAGLLAPSAPMLANVLALPLRMLVDWVTGVARVTASVPLALDARAALAVTAIGAASTAALLGRRATLRTDARRARRAVPDHPAR